MGPFLDHFGLLDNCGTFLGSFRISGSLRDHFGTILDFGIISGSFLDHFGFCDHGGTVLGSFWIVGSL